MSRRAKSPRAKRLRAQLLIALLATLAVNAAWARSSDRNQPMDIDAGRSEGGLDDRAPTVLSGGVTINQGTLDIRSSSATISTRNGDPSRAVLTGSPVVLKQLLDDGTPMTARASKVDYDLKTEVVVFTGSVQIEQPRGNMAGERIVYDMKTSRVESGGAGNGRVKMRINPKGAQGTPAAKPATKPADSKPVPGNKT